MATEQFSNEIAAAAVLSGAINSGQTSLVVSALANFPTQPQFRVSCEGEVMLVTGVSGSTFTVLRGQEGTTAASHASAVAIQHVLTAQLMANIYPNAIVQSANGNFSWPSALVKKIALNQGTPGACTVSINPASLVPGQSYSLKDAAYIAESFAIILLPTSGTIDNGSQYQLSANGQAVGFWSDGTNLWIES